MNIIGQDKILNAIRGFNLDTFPRSVMLVGPEGAGKHSLSCFIARHLGLTLEDISDKLTLETLDDIATRVEPSVYLINTTKITIKEQNTILKFVEEPLKNAYILILTESKNRLLDTVINRCLVWTLNNYSKSSLKLFLNESSQDNDLVLEIANTPGQVIKYQNVQFKDYVELARKIIECIDVASVPNTLTLVDKLQYKDEKDKLNADIFFSVLLHESWQAVKSCTKPYVNTLYTLTDQFKNDLLIANIDKKTLFENYLMKLWSEVRQ